MHFTRIISLLALAAPALTAPTALCYNYVLIDIRGTFEWPGASSGFKDMSKTILNTIPGGTQYFTNYPADLFNDSPKKGGDDIIRYINNGLQNCPSQKYALLGYSQGATVAAYATKFFSNTSSAGYKAIRGVFVIGNPAHEPNREANIDQDGGSTTQNCIGFQTNSKEHLPAVWYASSKLRDMCYVGDTYCCVPNPAPFFNFGGNHKQYPFSATVQKVGAQFLIDQLK